MEDLKIKKPKRYFITYLGRQVYESDSIEMCNNYVFSVPLRERRNFLIHDRNQLTLW